MKSPCYMAILAAITFASSFTNASAALMIVESGGNRVILASSVDGSIINPNFIVDNGLETPHSAIDSGRGTIFISDQLASVVREYSYSGAFLQTVVNNSQINNVRGIAVRDGALYVTVAGGSNPNTIQRFDLTSGAQTTFITNTNLGSPWDVTFRANDVLVSDGTANSIRQFDLSGNYIGNFTTGLSSPRQISLKSDGEVLVARNTAGGGVSRLTSTGTFIAGVGSSPAVGAYQLENGNYIYGGGINLWTTSGSGSDNLLLTGSGLSFRQIEFIAVPEPSSIAIISIGLVAFGIRRGMRRISKPAAS